jgi:hypothetical protein
MLNIHAEQFDFGPGRGVGVQEFKEFWSLITDY